MPKREMSWSAARKILSTVIHFDKGVKKYGIAKESNLAESTVYREVPKMVKEDLLSSTELNKTDPIGQKLKTYKITTKGVLVVLSAEKNRKVEGIMNNLVISSEYSKARLLDIVREKTNP